MIIPKLEEWAVVLTARKGEIVSAIINAKKVIRIDKDGNEKEYDSVKLAAADNNIYANQIARSVREDKAVKGYKWRYVEVEEEKSDFYMPLVHPVWWVAKANFERKPYFMGN